MDIIEDLGNDEIVEYQEIGETGGPELILRTTEKDGRTWPVYGVTKLYKFLKKLNEMGMLNESD